MSHNACFKENRKNRAAYQQVLNKKEVFGIAVILKKYNILRE